MRILRYILYWVTLSSFCLFLAGGGEGLVEQNHWLVAGFWLFTNLVLFFICYNTLSYKDVYKASGCQYLDSILKD